MSKIPIIFLAFANDRVDDAAYLRNLPKELHSLRSALEEAAKAGLCEVVERANATIDSILDVFQDSRYRDRIAVFHYGGHANGYQLLLENIDGSHASAHSEGLISFLAKQVGLQLVFLNGCSSQQQALDLINAGLPAVIGTSQSINDDVATMLSTRFYQSIGNGANLERAWMEAIDQQKIQKGTANMRDLFWEGTESEMLPDRFPWDIYYRDGEELVKNWNLPESTENPLFGLPSPEQFDLPEQPYRFLQRYSREHNATFFGRSYYIRDLYNNAIDPMAAPVLLFYGQSGVGKSSMLDAGVFPRLEQSRKVIYIRRKQSVGLLGTLKEALETPSSLSLKEAWHAIEKQQNKPLVILLDQVEECFTQPNKTDKNELDTFLDAVKGVFYDKANRPKGKLILSYRKEYHPEIKDACKERGIPREEIFLKALGRKDIIEVVKGLSLSERLKRTYKLEVEEELPVIIADDLLEDKESPIAPVLQILLTKMWELTEGEENRLFSVARYQQLRKDGILMDDFFHQQLQILEGAFPNEVASGLVLGLLQLHTTRLGTAGVRSLDELRALYANRQEVIDQLLAKLKDLYLLTSTDSQTTGLAHDTLAPLVLQEFRNSNKPAQRASIILDSKLIAFQQDEQHVIDADDLRIVEEGAHGMPLFTRKEQGLIDKSKAKAAAALATQEQARLREIADAKRIKKNYRKAIGAFILSLLVSAGAVFLYFKAQHHANEAEMATKQAVEATQQAVEAKNKTEEILRELTAASRKSVERHLLDASQASEEMDYSKAIAILDGDAKLGKAQLLNLADSIAAVYADCAYAFYVGGNIKLANESLGKGYDLLGKPRKTLIKPQPNGNMLEAISTLVADLGVNPQKLRNKYFPELVNIEGKGFQMGKYEVTVAQYMLFCQATNRELPIMKPSWGWQGSVPIVHVYWTDAIAYCNYASKALGLTPVYASNDAKTTLVEGANGLRLPTEAEWDYTAKGGNQDKGVYKYSGSNNIDDVAWFADNSSRPHSVGTKKPNGLGIYDMTGNVWEWCWETQENGRHLYIGGSWHYNIFNCEISHREDIKYVQYQDIGFRVCSGTM